jgi:hypothetical protein
MINRESSLFEVVTTRGRGFLSHADRAKDGAADSNSTKGMLFYIGYPTILISESGHGLQRPTCMHIHYYRGRVTEIEDEDDRPDDGGRKHLRNVGKLIPDYTAQYPRKQSYSYSPP